MASMYSDRELEVMNDRDLTSTLAQLEEERVRVEAALERRSNQAREVDTRPSFDPNSPHPHLRGTQRFHETIDAGGTTQEALSAFLQETLGAAAAGDERVIVPEPRIGSAE